MPVRPATPDDLEDIGALITELAQYEGLQRVVSFDLAELSRWLFGPDPAARVAAMLEDAQTVAVLAQERLADRLPAGGDAAWSHAAAAAFTRANMTSGTIDA